MVLLDCWVGGGALDGGGEDTDAALPPGLLWIKPYQNICIFCKHVNVWIHKFCLNFAGHLHQLFWVMSTAHEY